MNTVPVEPGYSARVITLGGTEWSKRVRDGRWSPLGKMHGGYDWETLFTLFPDLRVIPGPFTADMFIPHRSRWTYSTIPGHADALIALICSCGQQLSDDLPPAKTNDEYELLTRQLWAEHIASIARSA